MIISFSGAEGAGKSTIAKMLAENLGWPRYYIGGLRREKARERGLTLAEYNKLGEKDPATDREVDEYQKELGKKEDNFIIEGRTSWYFIPHSIKIYLEVSKAEGARRVKKELDSKNNRNEKAENKDLDSVIKLLEERRKSDDKRYQKYYNIKNAHNHKHFDLVIDTTKNKPAEVLEKILKYLKNQG
jgi:cytidylate kinase